jgi:hypothetical protein
VTQGWTVEQAREEAFREALPTMAVSQYAAVDPDYRAHRQALRQGRRQVGRRQLTRFQNGVYSVAEACGVETLIYHATGDLMAVNLDTNPAILTPDCPHSSYPQTSYKYAVAMPGFEPGQLVSISIYRAPADSYVFDTAGTLLGHWQGNRCTQANGEPCGTRQVFQVEPPSGPR